MTKSCKAPLPTENTEKRLAFSLCMTVYVLCMPEKKVKPKSQYRILRSTYETQIAKILSLSVKNLSAPAAAKKSAPAAAGALDALLHFYECKILHWPPDALR